MRRDFWKSKIAAKSEAAGLPNCSNWRREWTCNPSPGDSATQMKNTLGLLKAAVVTSPWSESKLALKTVT